MYNVVRTRELNSHGIDSRGIRSAIGCCLLKLTYGMYSICARCRNPHHARIASLITDESWIIQVKQATDASGRRSFTLLDTIEKLRVASYPLYRMDDVVCGVSAAFIHGLPMYRPPRGQIHVAHPTGRGKSSDLSRTTRTIPGEEVVHVGKLTLTSPIRTAFDLVGQLGEPEGFAALEAVLRRSVLGSTAVADIVARFGYPPDVRQRARDCVVSDFAPVLERYGRGGRKIERLLSRIGPCSESYAESRFVFNLMLLGITGFEQQVDVHDGNRHLARVDFMHRESRTIVFVDGVTKYVENGFSLMRKESAQYNRLLALGYRIVRLSFTDVIRLEDCATRLLGQAPWLRASQLRRGRAVR